MSEDVGLSIIYLFNRSHHFILSPYLLVGPVCDIEVLQEARLCKLGLTEFSPCVGSSRSVDSGAI